jgi:hypothetical protein
VDGTPLQDPAAGKNPAALVLSKLEGSKGGKGESRQALARQAKQIMFGQSNSLLPKTASGTERN